MHKYRLIIRLKTGNSLVLETKGQDTDQDKTKREFLDQWIKAVNEHGGFENGAGRSRESRAMLSAFSTEFTKCDRFRKTYPRLHGASCFSK